MASRYFNDLNRPPLYRDQSYYDPLPKDHFYQDPLARDLLPRDLQPRDSLPRDLQPRDALPRDLQPRDALPRDLQPKDYLPRDLLPSDWLTRDFLLRDQYYRDLLYCDQLSRDLLYRDLLYWDLLPRDPLPRDQRERILQLLDQNRMLRSALQFDNANQQQSLPSPKPAQSHQNNSQLVETDSRVVDPSKFQMVVNATLFRADKLDAEIMDGFIVVTSKHIKRPCENGFICRCKLPDEVDCGKITFSWSPDCVLTISAPKKVEKPTSLKADIGVQNMIEEPQKAVEGKILNVLEENSEQNVIGVQTKFEELQKAVECKILNVLQESSEQKVDS